MTQDAVFVVLPRWGALFPLLFSVIMVLYIVYTFRSGRPTRYRTAMRIFTLVCCSASILGSLAFAYHISQGHPVQTTSEQVISWGKVVSSPDSNVPVIDAVGSERTKTESEQK